jgi:hypothetical protein
MDVEKVLDLGAFLIFDFWTRDTLPVIGVCYMEFSLSLFFILVALGFELRALHLQSRPLPLEPPIHFALVILEIGSFEAGFKPQSSRSQPPK